jgi:hypothetical protein
MQARQSLGFLQRLIKLVEVTLLLRPHENGEEVDGNAILQLFCFPIHDVISKRGMSFLPQPESIGHLAEMLCARTRRSSFVAGVEPCPTPRGRHVTTARL